MIKKAAYICDLGDLKQKDCQYVYDEVFYISLHSSQEILYIVPQITMWNCFFLFPDHYLGQDVLSILVFTPPVCDVSGVIVLTSSVCVCLCVCVSL